MEEQRRQHQIKLLSYRLGVLDQASEKALREAQERLEVIVRTANRTIDGRMAFKDGNGIIRDQYGAVIGADEIDPISWRVDAPTFEGFREVRQQKNDAEQLRDKVQEHRGRLETGDLSEDELTALGEDVAELEVSLASDLALVNHAAIRATSAAKSYVSDETLEGSAPLREPFTGAVQPAAPTPESEPAGVREPASTLTPK